jgi:hypothetical protein
MSLERASERHAGNRQGLPATPLVHRATVIANCWRALGDVHGFNRKEKRAATSAARSIKTILAGLLVG